MSALEGFTETSFEDHGVARPVFRRGSGPGVVVMHEIPGITPEVARFARWVADAGFTVAMPRLFGTPGKPFSQGYALGQMVRACIGHEFHVLASRGASPITEWLRTLARALHAELGGVGVGAIGMCLTGNFALSLMLDECLMAPVLSQPSLPFPLTRERAGAIHLSDEDLARVKERVRAGVPVLGLRFTADPVCRRARFETLARELGTAFEAIEIDSSPGNAWGIPRHAHSVVTKDLVDREGHPTAAARDRVIAFFRERLQGRAEAASR